MPLYPAHQRELDKGHHGSSTSSTIPSPSYSTKPSFRAAHDLGVQLNPGNAHVNVMGTQVGAWRLQSGEKLEVVRPSYVDSVL
jgi:O-acetylhomoserine/O-acetylserine sulfhydrylase-like pyridoxal-dependent enzyme